MEEKEIGTWSGHVKVILFWALMFAGALLVLSRMGYSDGDDAYFYEYTHSMGMLEYLSWRYETWVGRVAAEALVYMTFRLGLGFWRIVNACMLVLLPLGIIHLVLIAARIHEKGLKCLERMQPACTRENRWENGLGISVAAVTGYLLMSVMTLGYAAVWVNGSIFYTWSFTCGIWALVPFAKMVYDDSNGIKKRSFLYSIPCSVAASMSIEQMGAVLLVFEVLAVLYCFWKKRKVQILLLVQTAVTMLAFAILFASPGNELRVAAEILTWMPEYESMPLGQHLFISLQWLISSFANENSLFLVGIWIVGMLLIYEKKIREKMDRVFWGLAGIFTVSALLPFAGITVLSDMGMNLGDIKSCIDRVPTAEEVTGANLLALFWWGAAILFTLIYISRVSGFQVTLILAYLAGIASEAIMFFSPTMYASGARVYYLTDWLLLFILLCLSLGVKEIRRRNVYYGILLFLGILHFLFQIPLLLEYWIQP